MSKRVSAEAALLMLHWQNSVCDPKGVWGKISAGRSRRITLSAMHKACWPPPATAAC